MMEIGCNEQIMEMGRSEPEKVANRMATFDLLMN